MSTQYKKSSPTLATRAGGLSLRTMIQHAKPMKLSGSPLALKPNVLSAIISIHSETLSQKPVLFAVVFLNLKRYNPTQKD